MSSPLVYWRWIAVAGLALLVYAVLTVAPALTQVGETEAPVEEAGNEAEDEAHGESFDVPNGTPKEIMAFIDELKARQPKNIRTRDAQIAYTIKVHDAVVAASDKLLLAKPDAELEGQVLAAKIKSLWMLKQLGKEGASEQVVALAKKLKTDKRPGVASRGAFFSIAAELENISADKPEHSQGLLDELKAQLAREEAEPFFLQLAMALPQVIEQSGQSALALVTYNDIVELLKGKNLPELDDAITQLEGSARKLDMIGKPLEIEGTLVTGETFDWSAYKGKVVLVDFWATWCGPCIDELPNVKAVYEKHHDEGFEVVGISLDEDKTTLEDFLAENHVPWPSLFGASEETSGWNHPMARKYGINAIPAALLVDKAGNVVTLAARGETLGKLVPELLAAEVHDASASGGAKQGAEPSDAKKAKAVTTK